MKNPAITFVAALLLWLGIFENGLIVPLTTLPISQTLGHLTLADYILLAATFAVLSFAFDVFDALTLRLKRKS